MARLRDPATGCEWDVAQTFATIAPYTIEEAYEVADAIDRGDMADLKDELGDLLLQIVFHSRIAEEAGLFTLDDVAAAVSDKMERRHPHIFHDVESSAHPEEPLSEAKAASRRTNQLWENVKAAERTAKGFDSALDGIALGLPALTRAEKIGSRAAGVGFDWPDASGARAKIDEELTEIDAAATHAEREGELGDLLFSVVNLARHYNTDPEHALRAATTRFEARFRHVERAAGRPLLELSLDDLERLWQQAKIEIGESAPF